MSPDPNSRHCRQHIMQHFNRLCTTAIGGRRGHVQFRDIADVVR